MTYDLTIGRHYTEDEGDEGQPDIVHCIETLELPEAPAFPGSFVSRHTNRISVPWGGYTPLASAVEAIDGDLADLLFKGTNDEVIIPVTADLVRDIHKLVRQYQRLHPNAVPRFEGKADADCILARLECLRWWSAYALEHFGADAAIRIS